MEKNDRKGAEKKQTEKLTLKDIITLLVIIIVVIVVMWGIMYWIIDRKNMLGAGVILILSFLYWEEPLLKYSKSTIIYASNLLRKSSKID